MNDISSLRILPAEAGAAALNPASEAGTGFREVLHSAIDDIQQLEGQAEAKVSQVLAGNGAENPHGAARRNSETWVPRV